MRGRPLCVASVILVLWIVVSGLLWEKEQPQDVKKEMTVTGWVEQFAGSGTKKTVIINDSRERIKVYPPFLKEAEGPEEKSFFAGTKIGQVVTVKGTLKSFSTPGNPGQFNEYRYYRELGISYAFYARSLTIEDPAYNRMEQGLYEIRCFFCGVLEQCLPETEAGIMAAMVFGEKSGLSTEIKDLYRKNGIAHILAISGLHVSLIGMGLFWFLRKYVMPMRVAVGVTVLFLLLYGTLTGFSTATERAVFMMICTLGARFTGRRYDRLSALSLSAGVQLLIQPALLFQSGFLMSYGTVLGIEIFTDGFRKLWENWNCRGILQKFRKAFGASAGIWLVTFPILLCTYYEWNPYSTLVNVLILPFVSALILFTVAGSLFFSVWSGLSVFLMGPVYYILIFYEQLCAAMVRMPGSTLISGCPSAWRVAGYYALLLLFSKIMDRKKRKREEMKDTKRQKMGGPVQAIVRFVYRMPAVCLILALFILLVPLPEQGGLSIINLDVGQGDGCCIRVDGKTVLIDGGSTDVSAAGQYRIASYLKYRGIRKIDGIFLTHSDADHVNGIAEILEDSTQMGFSIGRIFMPDIQKKDENYLELEQRIRSSGINLQKIHAGEELRVGDAVFQCLHPVPEYEWKSENDYSLVLLLKYGRFRGVFTGDLEEAGEKEVLCHAASLIGKVDYLKVGHHGSKTSSAEAFIETLRPDVSVVSVGAGNHYGHPAEETITRLQKYGSRIYRTDECGSVQVTVTDVMQVQTYR